jgi:ribosomal protein S16
VLKPGQSVLATNKYGNVEISYVSPTSRSFRWRNISRIVKMTPRQGSYLGALGLYDPAASDGDDGVRLVVQESNLYFKNYEEIYAFLHQSSEVKDWVYTSDGLVVGFSLTEHRNQANIDLWQLFIDKKKPSALRGGEK